MAKKGGQIQLQAEVNGEDDWEKLLGRKGLILVDVYSEWCGPCSAMSGNLKKIKLEIGGDNLHLAMAKNDYIKDLARFRNKSEPTWLFISAGKMVNLLFGANAPKLSSVLLNEIKKETQAIAEAKPREGVAITTPSPEEQQRYEKENILKLESDAAEAAAKDRAKAERLEVITGAVAGLPQGRYGLIVIFPYVEGKNEIISEIWNVFRQGVSEKVPFSTVNVDDLLYYTPFRFPPDLIEAAQTGVCTVSLIKNEDADVDIDKEVCTLVYGEAACSPGSPGSIAERLLTPYIPPKVESEAVDKASPSVAEIGGDLVSAVIQSKATLNKMNESKMDTRSVHSKVDVKMAGSKIDGKTPSSKAVRVIEEEATEIMLDGIWVPPNEKTRHMAMYLFLRNIFGTGVPPEPEPAPPCIAVAFDTWKRTEVLAAADEYSGNVLHIGFFTDEHPETAKLICKTPGAYDRRVAEQTDKLVIQLSKKHSNAVLAFSQMGPTYMSINDKVGSTDCKQFFPEDYDKEEELPGLLTDVAKPVKGKKKEKKEEGKKKDATGEPEAGEKGFVEGMAAGEDVEGADASEEGGKRRKKRKVKKETRIKMSAFEDEGEMEFEGEFGFEFGEWGEDVYEDEYEIVMVSDDGSDEYSSGSSDHEDTILPDYGEGEEGGEVIEEEIPKLVVDVVEASKPADQLEPPKEGALLAGSKAAIVKSPSKAATSSKAAIVKAASRLSAAGSKAALRKASKASAAGSKAAVAKASSKTAAPIAEETADAPKAEETAETPKPEGGAEAPNPDAPAETPQPETQPEEGA